MLYVNKNGKDLSKIVLGTADLGAVVSKQDSFRLMDAYFEKGGNAFDTGRVYCDWIEGGANQSESTLGEWVKSRGVRDRVWIATKGGHPLIDTVIPRLSDAELTFDIEMSLKYLQTEQVDIYYLHRDDPKKDVSEIMPILHRFVKEGKTRYIGASNWTAARIEEANAFAEENGLTKFSFSEIMWSYAKVNKDGERDKTLVIMDENEYGRYLKNDLILMPFSSQAQGFYTVATEKGVDALPPHIKAKYVNETNLRRLEKVAAISRETGISPTAVGLNHLLRNQSVAVTPIVGGWDINFLNDSLRSLELDEKYFAALRD